MSKNQDTADQLPIKALVCDDFPVRFSKSEARKGGMVQLGKWGG